ncbi:hypothetical protein JCM8097_002073 [Rhodosporidiobolus ruineniae]
MSQLLAGACLACGDETKNRCGACEQAGINLFFCSRECQKLIWPVHKKVCGPGKANPFIWPPLSKDEADEAKEHLNTKPLLQDNQIWDDTLADMLSKLSRDLDTDPESFLLSLVDGSLSNTSSRRCQTALWIIRSFEFDVIGAAALDAGARSYEIAPCDVFRFVARMTLRFDSLGGPNAFPPTVDHSLFRHQVLACGALTYAYEIRRLKASTAETERLGLQMYLSLDRLGEVAGSEALTVWEGGFQRFTTGEAGP